MTIYKVKNPTGEIKFNKKFYEKIRDGEKTQTFRLSSERLEVNENDIVTAIFPGTNHTLKIKIIKIGYKSFRNINLQDAKREGYNERSDLKNELLKIYPSLNHWDRLYYYWFEVI